HTALVKSTDHADKSLIRKLRRLDIAPRLCFFLMNRPPPRSTLFPYTTLFRSQPDEELDGIDPRADGRHLAGEALAERLGEGLRRDRKSTRLNSSHLVISYAVFCLKKKTMLSIAITPTEAPDYPHHPLAS